MCVCVCVCVCVATAQNHRNDLKPQEDFVKEGNCDRNTTGAEEEDEEFILSPGAGQKTLSQPVSSLFINCKKDLTSPECITACSRL